MKLLMERVIEIVERAKNVDSTLIKNFINDEINVYANSYEEYCKIWNLVDNLIK